jgi:GH18 family chitinase
MTAAIATWYKDKISDKALQQFDFVSIMSYDATGPWRPERPGPHSPYQMAVDDLQYWNETRLIPKEVGIGRSLLRLWIWSNSGSRIYEFQTNC